MKLLPAFVIALLPFMATAETTTSPQELEAWFNSKGADGVNEGKLTFLSAPPAKPVHHHQSRIRITPDSLVTGWTELEQCHEHLDAVPVAQITFREGFVNHLRILEARAIDRAWVEGASVQLQGVSPGARLCLAAQTRALKDSGSGYFTLNNGPYMRKFLDGYYPMRVSLQLDYPAQLLHVIDIAPTEQAGFQARQEKGRISIETLFEGELRTQVQFERVTPAH